MSFVRNICGNFTTYWQRLIWLFWKPSVWRNHFADFNLSPDFTLVNIWHSANLQNIEIQGFLKISLYLAFLLSLGVGLVLWFQGKPLVLIVLAITYTLIVV